jgi:hypothetical protein
LFPIEPKAPLVTAKHKAIKSVTPKGSKLVCDIELVTGQVVQNVPIYYELIGSSSAVLKRMRVEGLRLGLKTNGHKEERPL